MALAGAAFVACEPATSTASGFRIRASPTPPTVGENRIIVQLPPDLAEVSAVSVRARPQDGAVGPSHPASASGPDAWAVAGFTFERAGDWRLFAEVTLASGEVRRDSVDMRVVEGADP